MDTLTDAELLGWIEPAPPAVCFSSFDHNDMTQIHDAVKAIIAERDALRQWRFECCEALGLSCAAGAEWTVDDVFRCVQHEESKIIADRDRLAAEVLRLQDAVMKSDARGAALMAALRQAKRDYVRTLEAGRDRILELGGQCDAVDVMERGDPALRAIDLALSPATSTGSEVGK